MTPDYSNAQTLVFASCWTSQSHESIALWNFYTDLSGVRIEMPTLMFKGRHNNHKVTKNDIYYELNGVDYQIDRRGKNIMGMFGSVVIGPTKMRYYEKYEDLEIQCINQIAGVPCYDVRELGTRKHEDWRFEEEVRFRIFATFGYSMDENPRMSPQDLKDSPVVTEFIDIEIDDTALNEAKIVLGPKTSAAERIIVESLCGKYASKITEISKSSIQIR